MASFNHIAARSNFEEQSPQNLFMSMSLAGASISLSLCSGKERADCAAQSEETDPSIKNSSCAWESATASERFARSIMEQYQDQIIRPLARAHEAGGATDKQVFQAESNWEPYTSAHSRAVKTVLATPAPDMAAVIAKIDLGTSEGIFDGSAEANRLLLVLTNDIRRIANLGELA